jgi:hypothetical protein
MKLLSPVTILVLCLFASCQYDPFAGDLTTRRPGFTDVLGTYRLTKQTINEKELSKADSAAYIKLIANGTFIVSNLPNLLGDTGKYVSAQGLISSKGKWNIDVVGGVDNGIGHEKWNWGIVLTNMPDDLATIGFTGDSPPYGLMITNDDPDLGRVIVFSKK